MNGGMKIKEHFLKTDNRVAGGFSLPAPTQHSMQVRTGRLLMSAIIQQIERVKDLYNVQKRSVR